MTEPALLPRATSKDLQRAARFFTPMDAVPEVWNVYGIAMECIEAVLRLRESGALEDAANLLERDFNANYAELAKVFPGTITVPEQVALLRSLLPAEEDR